MLVDANQDGMEIFAVALALPIARLLMALILVMARAIVSQDVLMDFGVEASARTNAQAIAGKVVAICTTEGVSLSFLCMFTPLVSLQSSFA